MESDHLILEKVKDGDVNAFSILVEKHQRPLLCVILRMVGDLQMAEDVVQEAFFKAYQKLDTFEGRSSFKSWLFQIGLNTARNRLRSRKADTVDIEKVVVAVDHRQEADLSFQDLRSHIQEEVAKLPPKQKMALNLRVFEDMSFQEIAELMACPYDTAKANYRHALLKLKHRLGDNHELKSWTTNPNPKMAEADI